MPILWRYLLGNYLRILCLCFLSFIAVLLILRLDEIAHFATLGPEGELLLRFIAYQIPYILPIALPISSLIAAIILVQRLSGSYELTAMRASGLSLRQILSPILIVAAYLAVINFYIVSEISTQSHLEAGLLKNELRSINPLLVANNKHIMRARGYYYHSFGPSHSGESASDVIIAVPNKSNNLINLIVAKELQTSPEMFTAQQFSVVAGVPSTHDHESQDALVLENIQRIETSLHDFSHTVKKKTQVINNDHLQFRLLGVRLKSYKDQLRANEDPQLTPHLKREVAAVYSEIARRISLGLAAFTFTLMGATLGISISRNRSSRGIFLVIVLVALTLSAFFLAQGIKNPHAASLLYIVPHLLIVGVSFWTLRRVVQGIE